MNIYEQCLLHARADRALRAIVGMKLEEYNLTMMEWLLLGVVSTGPQDGLSMSSVAQTLDVTLPQVTALTNKLLEQKLIRQKTQARDRRSRHIMPTGKGCSLLEDIDEAMEKAFKEWQADLSKADLEGYHKILSWMAGQRHVDSDSLANAK